MIRLIIDIKDNLVNDNEMYDLHKVDIGIKELRKKATKYEKRYSEKFKELLNKEDNLQFENDIKDKKLNEELNNILKGMFEKYIN